MPKKRAKDYAVLLNSLSKDPEFRRTTLYRSFEKHPLGFVDVGSMGGVHPLLNPVASLVHALCFEPDPKASKALVRAYKSHKPFREVTVRPIALARKRAKKAKLFVCKTPTNTSLLEPDPNFIERYKAGKFELDHLTHISTDTLDHALTNGRAPRHSRMGEFIKLDTQGTEFDILGGAEQILKKRCVGIWCETEFFEVYKGQKTYADIDLFLREYGFFIYGFYPHYRSTKTLDPSRHTSEERIMWADALFLKDPLDPRNKHRSFSDRDIHVLILVAMVTHFFDFALELVKSYYAEGNERARLEFFIKKQSQVKTVELKNDVNRLYRDCRRRPRESRILLGRFVDRHRSNNSIDYVIR